MPNFEYQSLKKHLDSRAKFMGLIANHILRTAQDDAVDNELDIAAEDIPYEYDFLEDRILLAEMLAERPEVAFVECHNNGFSLQLREQKALSQVELEGICDRHHNHLHDLPDGQRADFSGMVLLGLNMHGMDFSTADFSGAVLRECDMGNSSFDGCDFAGATLHAVQAGGTSFEQANFTGTCFNACNFFHADFECGDFTRAVFEDTNMHHANLDGCAFYGARFEHTDLSEASTALVKGLPDNKGQAVLEVIQARHTLWRYGEPDGRRADFTRQGVTNLDFSGRIFDDALFCETQLYRCDFAGCSLDCADFAGAKLYDCDFTGALLDGTDFTQAELVDCVGLDDITQGPAMEMGGGMT